ncbi:MAG: UDP-N-acetylmuramate dehydrogenase [SAR324 cluster bacterium]|nr:UDP-N-acetylmuramate dehydrogenase [SAR324 cluster bacterium]
MAKKNLAPDHEAWKEKLQKIPLQSKLFWAHSLKRFNTLKVGGAAACLVDVMHTEDLSRLLPFLRQEQIPWFILGKGSNLIFPDDGWPGVVLRLSSHFKQWEVLKEHRQIFVGAALADVTVALRCASLGWSGLEFLIGIPGSIGGAIAMNAGAHGGEISQYLKKIWWMDMAGKVHEAEGKSLAFAYRQSPLNGKLGTVVTSALFQLEASDPETVKARIRELQTFREEKQPRNIPNCGSVFKNPDGRYAAELIESAGLKGHCIGGAQISPVHSNFIVNQGEATAQDVLALIDLVQKTVWKTHQINLEPEVQIVAKDHY